MTQFLESKVMFVLKIVTKVCYGLYLCFAWDATTAHLLYVQCFLTFLGWAFGEESADKYKLIIFTDRKAAAEHVRKHDEAVTSEADKTVSGADKRNVSGRDNYLRRRAALYGTKKEVLYEISISHMFYDPLSYVLHYPYGDNSCHFPMYCRTAETNGRENGRIASITAMIFYTYKLFQRPSLSKTLLQGGFLSERFIVDQYCKLEAERIKQTRENQEALCTADYPTMQNPLADAGNEESEHGLVRAGRLFVLPSSYAGGHLYMHQKCMISSPYQMVYVIQTFS